MAENFFTALAGESPNFFTIGDIEFKAAGLTIAEYAEYLSVASLPPRESFESDFEYLAAREQSMQEKMSFWAKKLQPRVKGTKVNRETITAEWLSHNLPLPKLPLLEHVLLHEEMPKAGGDDEGKP